jgi:hypothetical protein
VRKILQGLCFWRITLPGKTKEPIERHFYRIASKNPKAFVKKSHQQKFIQTNAKTTLPRGEIARQSLSLIQL